MKMIILSLFDLKAREYRPPMYVASIPVALRDLGDQVTAPNNTDVAAKHPEDFELHQLAEFDTTTGRYKNCLDEEGQDKPKFLFALKDLVPTKQ